MDATKAKGLDPERYVKRLEAADASLLRVFVGLLALTAFWLTIEIENTQYAKLRQQYATITQKTIRQESLLTGLRATLANSQDFSEARVKAVQSEVQTAKNGLTQLQAARDALDATPLQLTILGTSLPSTMPYATHIWLVALLVNLLFLVSYRQAVFRSIAGLDAVLPPDASRHGYAGDGSPLLAPLPSLYRRDEPGSAILTRDDLRSLLGWSPRAEGFATLLALILGGVVLLVALRVTFLAYLGTDEVARAANFVGLWWHLVGFPLAALLMGAVLLVLAAIALPFFAKAPPDMIDRRALLAIAGIGALVAAVPLGLRLGRMIRMPRTKSRRGSRRRGPVFAASGLAPNRLCTRISSKGSPGRELHWVEANGTVALHDTPLGRPRFGWVRLGRPNAAGEYLTPRLGEDDLVVRRSGLALERAALVLLKSGKTLDAIDCLLFACRLDAAEFGLRGTNLRIYDLLWGLILRYQATTDLAARKANFVKQLDSLLEITARYASDTEPGDRNSRYRAKLAYRRDQLLNPTSLSARRWADRGQRKSWTLCLPDPSDAATRERRKTALWTVELD